METRCRGGFSGRGRSGHGGEFWCEGRGLPKRKVVVRRLGGCEADCERCFGDEEEPTQVQEVRRHEQRERGNRRERWKGERVEVTVDKVLRFQAKMMKNQTNGPGDCLVSEMVRELPMETVGEIPLWFGKRFRGECRTPAAWKILRLVFLKKPDAEREKGIRECRAIALMWVLEKWYACYRKKRTGCELNTHADSVN